MSAEDPIVVVGAGPAGLACAIRLGSAGVPVTIVEGTLPGGQLWEYNDVGLLPGLDVTLTGNDLSARLQEQAAAAGVGFEFARVVGVSDEGQGSLELHLEGGTVMRGRGVVAATGATRLPIVPLEGSAVDESLVTHCIPCDGPLLAGRDVAFIGMEAPLARDLAAVQPFASASVVIAPAGHTEPTGLQSDQVRFVAGDLVSVVRNNSLFELVVISDGEKVELATGAVVSCLGYQPASAWLPGEALDAGGWVADTQVGRRQWAVGSVTRSLRSGAVGDVIADGWRVASLIASELAGVD
jgi:thioredoxin reductase (NADPH)